MFRKFPHRSISRRQSPPETLSIPASPRDVFTRPIRCSPLESWCGKTPLGSGEPAAAVPGRSDVSLWLWSPYPALVQGPAFGCDSFSFCSFAFSEPVLQPSDKSGLSLHRLQSVLFLHQITETDTEWNTDWGSGQVQNWGTLLGNCIFKGINKDVKNRSFGGSVSLWSSPGFDSFPFGLLLSSSSRPDSEKTRPLPFSRLRRKQDGMQRVGAGSLLRSRSASRLLSREAGKNPMCYRWSGLAHQDRAST